VDVITTWCASAPANVDRVVRSVFTSDDPVVESAARHLHSEGEEMETRTVETILSDWRSLERELETASDNERPAIQARIDQLREEHRQAMHDREAMAHELGQALA
jgi:inosine-uridine nucleoside N-ribohydrolase